MTDQAADGMSRPMDRARRRARLFALSAVALGCGLVAGWWLARDTQAHEVSWLYSQTADSAELVDRGDGTYLLTLHDTDRHTVMFADRPERLAEIIDTAELIEMWDVLFATSSPNAVLVEHEPDGSTDSIVVVLDNPNFDAASGELSYVATILADEMHPERLQSLANPHSVPPTSMGAVSLFIDSVTEELAIGEPIFSGPVADALASRLGLPGLPTEALSIGGGVRILAAETVTDADGVITSRARVGFHDDSFELLVDLTLTDAANWTIDLTAESTDPWNPDIAPGLTIDPSTFSGTIVNAAGSVTFDVRGSNHTWQIADGATYVSTLSLTSSCPLTAQRCSGDVRGPFVSMDGTLTIAGIGRPIEMTGAMSTNARWARFDGLAGDVVFAGNGVTDATLTMWRGARSDTHDSAMVLPELGVLAGGNNLEFCGGLTIDLPSIGNQSTDGCVRWAPSGVVVGQIVVGGRVAGSLPSTGVSAEASADVAGAGFTNLSGGDLDRLSTRDIVMAGVAVELRSDGVVVAGRASLPGLVADALNIALDPTTLAVEIRGSVSPDGYELSGAVETAIAIGMEPFKIVVEEMMLSISGESRGGATFALGTEGQALVGYSPDTRILATSVRLVAATAPRFGMELSVTARGTPSASDSNHDGLTIASRLTSPADAQYVWPDQFGIKGLNLWNLTVQIAYVNGSPALGFTSTSYIDPNGAHTGKVLKCSGPCDSNDWMIGTLGFNVSYSNPCFAYSFESASGSSGFAIDGGVLMAKTFKIGMAPAGCSIQSGNEQLVLPVGFAGFQFSASFGDSPGTTLDVATKVSVEGFVFDAEITNLELAGISYSDLRLRIDVDESASDLSFAAVMSSGMGDMSVEVEFEASSRGIRQSLDAELSDWQWGKSGTVDLEVFNFSTSTTIPAQGGCATFETAANGSLSVGSREFDLVDASIKISCNGVERLHLEVLYDHKVRWNGALATGSFELEYPCYPNSKVYLCGDVGFSYTRHFSAKYDGRTFSRDVNVAFNMSVMIDKKNPSQSGFRFEGDFEADRVSGAIACSMDPGRADFKCGGELRLNPSWAGVYHFNWGDM